MTITLYSKPNCVQCQYTSKQLDDKDLHYNTLDITVDDEARKMVQDSGKTELPMVVVEYDDGQRQVWHGFQLDKIRGLSKAS